MTIETTTTTHQLPLETTFSISRGDLDTVTTTVVRISDGTHTGIGAAAPDTHYGETPATVDAVLPELLATVEDIDDPHQLARIRRACDRTVRQHPAAKAAVSIALHDLVAAKLSVPLYQYWGLDPTQAVDTSYTVGLDTVENMVDRARAAVEQGYDILKLKLGTDPETDRAIVRQVRAAVPDARIRVDANEAWSVTEAIRHSSFLADHDIEFLEQPVPAEQSGALKRVTDRAAVPIAADESCRTLTDIPALTDSCDIVNIKLMKCGGLLEARRMIHAARAHGLSVMLGCMIESNASIAAACHLTPLVDYADLDGALLLADDPYQGVPMSSGTIDLTAVEQSGTGARSRE